MSGSSSPSFPTERAVRSICASSGEIGSIQAVYPKMSRRICCVVHPSISARPQLEWRAGARIIRSMLVRPAFRPSETAQPVLERPRPRRRKSASGECSIAFRRADCSICPDSRTRSSTWRLLLPSPLRSQARSGEGAGVRSGYTSNSTVTIFLAPTESGIVAPVDDESWKPPPSKEAFEIDICWPAGTSCQE